MRELVTNAWLGWENYISLGKLAALFWAAVLFLLLRVRPRGSRRGLLLFGAVAGAACMVPVTAAVLMLYQTKFYDYQWVWSMVPMTAVTAWAAVEFAESCGKFGESGKKSSRSLIAAVLLAAVLLFCGGMRGIGGSRDEAGQPAGPVEWNSAETLASARNQAAARQQAKEVLAELREQAGERDICLWAPRSILEYVRELDGGIRLVYGRNMWDISLNAFSYDGYGPQLEQLYRFMEQASGADEPGTDEPGTDEPGTDEPGTDEPGTGVPGTDEPGTDEAGTGVPGAAECVRTALDCGVNCILLPADLPKAERAELEKAMGVPAQPLGNYIVLIK